MKLDLKEWINKITSRKPVYEYVGNMSSYVFNSSWTATDDGVAIVRATWDTTGAFGYWYINDTTDNIQVCNLGGTSNGTSLSAMIPIIKGHSYANAGSAHVYYAFFQFYKMKWGGYCLTVFSRLSAIFGLGVA